MNDERWHAWLRQAELDLEAAALLAAAGRFEWACFCCHQAAEKALKAILVARGREELLENHSIVDLLRRCRRYATKLKGAKQAAKALEWHYLLARYPADRLDWVAPGDIYSQRDYAAVRDHSEQIVTACRATLRPEL
jgi:HEPN domain-containing protein